MYCHHNYGKENKNTNKKVWFSADQHIGTSQQHKLLALWPQGYPSTLLQTSVLLVQIFSSISVQLSPEELGRSSGWAEETSQPPKGVTSAYKTDVLGRREMSLSAFLEKWKRHMHAQLCPELTQSLHRQKRSSLLSRMCTRLTRMLCWKTAGIHMKHLKTQWAPLQRNDFYTFVFFPPHINTGYSMVSTLRWMSEKKKSQELNQKFWSPASLMEPHLTTHCHTLGFMQHALRHQAHLKE